MEALKALDYGFTIDEIVENIDDMDYLYQKEDKHIKDNICTECENE